MIYDSLYILIIRKYADTVHCTWQLTNTTNIMLLLYIFRLRVEVCLVALLEVLFRIVSIMVIQVVYIIL